MVTPHDSWGDSTSFPFLRSNRGSRSSHAAIIPLQIGVTFFYNCGATTISCKVFRVFRFRSEEDPKRGGIKNIQITCLTIMPLLSRIVLYRLIAAMFELMTSWEHSYRMNLGFPGWHWGTSVHSNLLMNHLFPGRYVLPEGWQRCWSASTHHVVRDGRLGSETYCLC